MRGVGDMAFRTPGYMAGDGSLTDKEPPIAPGPPRRTSRNGIRYASRRIRNRCRAHARLAGALRSTASIPALASGIERSSIRSMPKWSLARFCSSIRWRLANEKIAHKWVCVAEQAWRRCESGGLYELICGRPNFRSRVFQKLVFRPPHFSFRASGVGWSAGRT